jgi:hypothetical protein
MPNNNTLTGGGRSAAMQQAYGYNPSESTRRYVPMDQGILESLEATRRAMGRPVEGEPQDSRATEEERVRQRLREEREARMRDIRRDLDISRAPEPNEHPRYTWTTPASMGLNRNHEDSAHSVEVTYHRARNRYRENPTDASEEIRGELIEAFCALLDGGFHV